MSSFKAISPLILENKVFKDFTIYGHGNHVAFCPSAPRGSTRNLVTTCPVAFEIMFQVSHYMSPESKVSACPRPLVFTNLYVFVKATVYTNFRQKSSVFSMKSYVLAFSRI